jgi:hypothetical protein
MLCPTRGRTNLWGKAFDDPDKEGHQIPIQSYVILDGLKLTVTKNLWVAL